MTKQEQIEDIAKYVCNVCDFKCDWFQSGMKEDSICTTAQETAEALYNAGYRKIDEFEKCRKCPAWSGTDCTRNPYTESCLDDKVNLKNEIKRLEKENAFLLKACEEQFTFDTTQNKKYSVFNSVRKEFAEKLKKYSYTDNCFTDGKWHRYVLVSDIDELMEDYENGK